MNLDQNVTKPRGRPKSEEKRQSISEAAAELFLKEGFDRCSMDSIAQAAGVSKQTVYSHFANKEELFKSCITNKVRLYDLAIDPSVHARLEDGLASFADGFLRLISDPQAVEMWRLMINEAVDHQHVAAIFHETGPEVSLNSLSEFLERHGDRLDATDYEAAARTYLGLTADCYHTRILLGVIDKVDDAEREQHVARVTEQFMRLFGAAN